MFKRNVRHVVVAEEFRPFFSGRSAPRNSREEIYAERTGLGKREFKVDDFRRNPQTSHNRAASLYRHHPGIIARLRPARIKIKPKEGRFPRLERLRCTYALDNLRIWEAYFAAMIADISRRMQERKSRNMKPRRRNAATFSGEIGYFKCNPFRRLWSGKSKRTVRRLVDCRDVVKRHTLVVQIEGATKDVRLRRRRLPEKRIWIPRLCKKLRKPSYRGYPCRELFDTFGVLPLAFFRQCAKEGDVSALIALGD